VLSGLEVRNVTELGVLNQDENFLTEINEWKDTITKDKDGRPVYPVLLSTFTNSISPQEPNGTILSQ
jgi:hypothetical protein